MTAVTNQQIYDLLQEVKVQNNDLKADIKEIRRDLGKYRVKVQELEDRVVELESEKSYLRERVRHFEEFERKNQVVVFGLDEREDDSLEERTLEIFSRVLSVNVKSQDLDNIYRIGRRTEDRIRPVIVRFVRLLAKNQILKHLSKLKGTGITIINDLTFEQQQDKKLLYKYFKIAKSKNFQAKIIKNCLLVNDNSFTVTELREASEETFTDFFINKKQLFTNNSAPATPEVQGRLEISSPITGEEIIPPEPKKVQSPQQQQSGVKEVPKQLEEVKPREKTKKQDTRNQGQSTPSITRTTRQAGRSNSTSSFGKPADKTNRKAVM